MANDLLIKVAADVGEFQDTLGGLGEKLLSGLKGINPAVAGIVAVVGGVSAAAVSVAEEWEDAFHSLQQNTGASGEALEGLKADWEAVFKTGDEDAKTVAAAVGDVAQQLGLVGEPLQTVSRNFLDLAGIVGEDVNSVVKSSTAAFNDWKISGDKIADSQNFLLKVNQATGISIGELTGQLAQSGSTLRNLGLDFETSATLIGQLSKVGPGASEAIAGLSRAVTNLTKDGKDSKTALQEIFDKIKNAPNDTAAASEAMEVFGDRAGAKLSEQIRAGKFDVDALTETLKNTTTTISDVDNATDGFSAKLGELWNNLQPLLVPLGTVLVDAAEELITSFTDLVKWLGSEGAAGAFSGLLTFVQPIIDAFNNNMRPALEAVGTLLLGLGVTIVQNALIPTLQFLWNNVLVPLGGFLRDVLAGAINTVYGALNTFLGVLKDIPGVSSLFEAGQKALNTVLGDAKSKTDDAKTSTTALKDSHSELASTITTKTHPAVTQVTTSLKDKKDASDLAKKATSDLQDADKVLADALNTLVVPAHKSLLQAQKDVTDARTKETDAAKKLQDAEADLRTKLDNSKTSTKDLKSAIDALDSARKNAKLSTDNLKGAESALSTAQKQAKEDADSQKKAFDDIAKSLNDMKVDVFPSVTVGVQTMDDAFNAIKGTLTDTQQKAFDTQNALKALGVTPKEDLQSLADQAQANFKTIQNSGTASATEIDKAQLAMLNNLKAYYQQSGQDLPPELQATLTDLEGKYNTHKDNVSGPNGTFAQMKTNINQSITQLSTDLVKSLWEGDGSFGDKAMSTLKGIGESVTTAFITPATTAISNFVSGTIADLLGGKGLGGITDKLGDIGKSFSGIFGGGGSTPSVPTSVPTGGGNPAGGAAGVASSGVTGILTSVFTGISAVTDVLSMFGVGVQGSINNHLKEIKNDTAYLAWNFDQGGLHDALLGFTNNFIAFNDGGFGGWFRDELNDGSNLQYEMNDRQKWLLIHLESIDTLMNTVATATTQSLDALRQIASYQPVVNVKAYLDSNEISTLVQVQIENDIKAALA